MAILTISREFGSDGREIGQTVAKILNYEYINKERLMGDMRTAGKEWEKYGKDLDEHCPTIWEKYDWSFRGFNALLQSLILNYALNDRAVIMGRGGNFLLKDIPYALRIRVVAPLDKRIDRIMRRESVDRDTAHWLIEKTDKERACFIHLIYGKHWDSLEEYDTVLDTDSKSIDELTDLVKEQLISRDGFRTEEARNDLRMRALSAKIKAELLTNPSFFIPTLDVIYNGKEIVLRGVIHNPKEHKRIEDTAKKTAGDITIKCMLHYRG